MAIFHLSVKTISRSAGRSVTAAAAYRAAEKIIDERTGEVHDYERKGGVESAVLFLPNGAPEWATDRAKLWNAAEQSEKRKNSTVAREFVVALPSELSAEQRRKLVYDFARKLVKRHGCAVDVAIHEPGKEGDTRNHHAHILCSTRRLTAEGFTEKTRELDDRVTGSAEVTRWREQWADMTNAALERAGHAVRVDHRSLEMQGIDREPTIHLGPAATAIERRGEVSEKTQHHQERQQEAAGKVAAMVAIAEAKAKAATETKEKENDRIRATALAALAKPSRAAGRALAFTVADHAGIADHLKAAGGDLGRAVEGTRRRVDERRYGRIVEAVRGQFERVGGVVQQVADRVGNVVRTVAAAAHQVAQKARSELERKRVEKPVSRYHPDNIAAREAAERAAAQAAAAEKQAGDAKRLAAFEKQVKADMAAMKAKRAAQAPTPAPAPDRPPQARIDPAEAERQRLARMSSAELAEEIRRRQLPSVASLVEEDRAVSESTAKRRELHKQQEAAAAFVAKAERAQQAWREQHPAKAKMHDSGLWRSAELEQLGQQAEQGGQGLQALQTRSRMVAEKDTELRRQAHSRIAMAQSDDRAELEKLEQLRQDKASQERAAATAKRELEAVPKDFRGMALGREAKAFGWGDSGSKWKATPEQLKKLIEGYNAAPKEARAAILDRLTSDRGSSKQVRELLDTQQTNYRKSDRGLSR